VELFSYILSQFIHCWCTERLMIFIPCHIAEALYGVWEFGVEFFGSFRYRIMLSANRDTLTVSLPICIPFISSSCLIALSRNSRTMLNRSEESGNPCLVPDFRGNSFSFSSIKFDVPYMFVIYSLYNVEVLSFYSSFS
jgi:hypothetical protein